MCVCVYVGTYVCVCVCICTYVGRYICIICMYLCMYCLLECIKAVLVCSCRLDTARALTMNTLVSSLFCNASLVFVK